MKPSNMPHEDSAVPGTPGSTVSALESIERTPSLRQSFERAASLTGALHTPFELPPVDPYDGEAQKQHTTYPVLDAAESPLACEPVEPVVEEARTWTDAGVETKRLLSIALPLMVQALSSMMLNVISTTFVGHLNSAIELSAVVLANSVYNVTGYSVVIGVSSAMDTLCGQAYGAKNYPMLGAVLQRAQVILWLMCVPIMAMWTQMDKILLLLGQGPELVRLTTRVLNIMGPSLLFSVVSDTTRRYLLAQRVVRPGMVCYLVTVAFSPLLNWLFIYRLGWRTAGAAVAFLSSQVLLCAQISLYRLYRDCCVLTGKHQRTWHGWSTASAFGGWRTYLAYGLPAAAMICFEWWVWEAMIIMAGVLPTAATAVGVMGISMQISSFSYMIPASFGSATAVRVSNLLGGALAQSARMVAWISVVVMAAVMVVLAALTWAARSWVVGIFTDEPGVTAMTKAVLPAVAASLIGDGLVAVLSGVLRGCGRQGIGAAFNLAGYWCIGLPLAFLLGFKADMGITGFWVALASAALLQACVFTVVISRLDWNVEVRRACALTGKPLDAEEGGSRFAGVGTGPDVAVASSLIHANGDRQAQQLQDGDLEEPLLRGAR